MGKVISICQTPYLAKSNAICKMPEELYELKADSKGMDREGK